MDNTITAGFALTGSYCTYSKVFNAIESLVGAGINLIPIFSDNSVVTDTRFGKASDFIKKAEEITGNKLLKSISDVEPIGPKNIVDIILVVPCTGNTIAKLANGITDTPVTMAVKSHIRNNKPVLIGVSTNDGLGVNLKNIGVLLDTKNFYFIPFRQDDYINKPKSLVLDYDKVIESTKLALDKKQIEPLLV